VPSHRTFQISKLKKTLNHSIGEVGCCGSSESASYSSRSNGVYTSGSSCTLEWFGCTSWSKSPKGLRFLVVRFSVVRFSVVRFSVVRFSVVRFLVVGLLVDAVVYTSSTCVLEA